MVPARMGDPLDMLGVLREPAETAARRVLGWVLCRRLEDASVLRGRIVETEAYAGVVDAACHSYRGHRSPRNEAMYGPPGTAYVYFTYGMHWCLNVVCAARGDPQAVLVRALEPIEGADRMEQLRLANPKAARGLASHKVASGPARLCAAMGLDRSWNAVDLLANKGDGPGLWLEPGPGPEGVLAGPRIGIDRAGEPWVSATWRFGVAGSKSLSRKFG